MQEFWHFVKIRKNEFCKQALIRTAPTKAH